MLISMSPEKIICVHLRNLWEINSMNNPRVKNIRPVRLKSDERRNIISHSALLV